MICKDCGTVLGDQDAFCVNCGAPVAQAAPAPQPAQPAPQPTQPVQQPQQFNQNPQPTPTQQPFQQPAQTFQQPQQVAPQATPAAQTSSNLDWLWGILGFFIPLAGGILFFVWKNEKPKSAKFSGIGALIGIGLNILTSVIFTVIILAQSASY